MTEEKLGFFDVMTKSMFDIRFYRRILNSPLKKSILYLVMFGLFIGSLGSIKMSVSMSDQFQETQNDFLERATDIQVNNGILTIEGMDRFVRKYNDFEVYVDANINSNEAEYSEMMGLYVLKDAVLFRVGQIEQYIDYGIYNEFDFNSYLGSFLDTIRRWIFVTNILTGAVAGIFSKFFDALIACLLGLIITKANRINLNFPELFQISAHAITLPSIIVMLADIFLMSMPTFSIVYFVLIAMYHTRVFKVISEEE